MIQFIPRGYIFKTVKLQINSTFRPAYTSIAAILISQWFLFKDLYTPWQCFPPNNWSYSYARILLPPKVTALHCYDRNYSYKVRPHSPFPPSVQVHLSKPRSFPELIQSEVTASFPSIHAPQRAHIVRQKQDLLATSHPQVTSPGQTDIQRADRSLWSFWSKGPILSSRCLVSLPRRLEDRVAEGFILCALPEQMWIKAAILLKRQPASHWHVLIFIIQVRYFLKRKSSRTIKGKKKKSVHCASGAELAL